MSEQGPQIIELAARLSGNYLATHHIPIAYGVDIVGAVIRLSLGEPVSFESLKPKIKRYLGVRYFFPTPGRIQRINGIDQTRALDYVRMLDVYPNIGDIQAPIVSHGARAGTVICEGPDYDSAKKRVEDATAGVEFLVI